MILGQNRNYIKELKLLKFHSLHVFEPKFGFDPLVLFSFKDIIS